MHHHIPFIVRFLIFNNLLIDQFSISPVSAMTKTKCKLKIQKTQQDIISFLPEDVLNKILGNLPIKEAIQTSFLSKEWRYKWRSMSDLIFDSDSFFTPNDQEYSDTLMILYLIKVLEFLFLHRGNIRTFQFNSRWEIISSKVDIWMDYLINSSIQQLKLTFATEYLIPSSIFRFDKLTVLDLKSCKLILPTSFDGFKNLTTLRLHSITFDDNNMLEILIKLCPILRILDVRTLLGSLQRLILHASNLQCLVILGSLSYLEFKESRMLTRAVILLNPSESLYDLTNILSNLSNVEHLIFWGSNDSLVKKIDINPSMIEHIKFNQLKKLHLCVNLDCSKETFIVCCILKNCPSLSYLLIHFKHLEVEDESLSSPDMFWNDMRSSSSNINYLKIFDVNNVHGSESELRFIAYIYEITPILEVYNIEINWENIPFGKDKMGNILIELLSFKRASGAKVIIQKPLD